MSRRGAPTSVWPSLPKEMEAQRRVPKGNAKLIVRRPEVPEVEIPIEKELIIGRSPALADLVLDEDLVSRRHAQLTVNEAGYYTLKDLDSQNGITYGGRTVRRLNLRDGDEFAIGQTKFLFQAEMPRIKQALEQAEKAKAPPRMDSVMLDMDKVAVPEPMPEPEPDVDGFEQLGWSPEKAASQVADTGAPEPEVAVDPGDAEEQSYEEEE